MWNQIKTVVLLGALTAGLIAFGGMFGKGPLLISVLAAAALNLGAYFFSDRLVLRMHGAKEVDANEAPELHRIVYELSLKAGLPRPRVCIIPSSQPNAFATGRNPQHGVVAVTTGILQLLNERELRGVIAHELAHIKNRDILLSSIAAAVAGALTFLANMLQWSAIFGGSSEEEEGQSPLAMLGLALVAPFVATLVQLGISRAREYEADRVGALIASDPIGLANALEKLEAAARYVPAANPQPATASLFIVNPFAGAESVVKLFSTHPPVRERVRRLVAMAGVPLRSVA